MDGGACLEASVLLYTDELVERRGEVIDDAWTGSPPPQPSTSTPNPKI